MKKILVCLALSTILLTGCVNNNEEIIKVNGTAITRGEFDKAVDKAIDSSEFAFFGGAKNFVKSDDNMMYVIFKEKVVKELLVKALLEEECVKRGIEVTEEDLKNEIKTVIDKMGSKEELNKTLKQRGVSNDEFTEGLKSQIKMRKLAESISEIKISDADAKKYYNNNINKFKYSEQVRASHILISADTLQIIRDIKAKNKNISAEELNKKVEETMAAKKVIAEKVLKEVKANPDNFETIAMEKSEDKGSGERGGELGYFSKEDMVPEFSKAAFAMKPNTISDSLVKSQYGYHIIKVTDRIEPGTTPFEKRKDEIKFYLEVQERISILKKLTDGLMKTAKIEYIDSSYDPEKLAKLNLKQAKEDSKKENK